QCPWRRPPMPLGTTTEPLGLVGATFGVPFGMFTLPVCAGVLPPALALPAALGTGLGPASTLWHFSRALAYWAGLTPLGCLIGSPIFDGGSFTPYFARHARYPASTASPAAISLRDGVVPVTAVAVLDPGAEEPADAPVEGLFDVPPQAASARAHSSTATVTTVTLAWRA